MYAMLNNSLAVDQMSKILWQFISPFYAIETNPVFRGANVVLFSGISVFWCIICEFFVF